MASAAQKILRPLSRLRRQLPLRRGAKGVRQCYRVRLPPLCKGRWIGLGRAGGVVFFSGDLKLYRCVYCGCPTGSCRPNRKKRAGNARPYVIDFCSDYARRGDHWSPVVQVLPEATPQSRQAVAAPLTQGSQGGRQYYRVRLTPLCKGRWVGRLRPSRWGCLFQRRFKIVPMRILRLPDRKLPTKP